MNRFIFCILLLALPAARPGCAQPGWGWIEGKVQDALTLQAIEGVRIYLLDLDGKELLRASTDSSGDFLFNALHPSDYQVTCEEPAYVTSPVYAIRVETGQASIVSLQMNKRHEGSQTSQSLGWHGQPVNLWESALGTVFDRHRVEKLPSPRNIWSLLGNQEISSVVNRIDEGGIQTGIIGLVGAHGDSWTQNAYRLNGLNVTNPYETGKPLVYPSFGSLEEFRAATSLHPATDLASGSSLQLTNRRGGSEFHAQAELYYLGSPLQSSNLDDRLREFGFSNVPRFRHFGEADVSAGGPVPRFHNWSFFSNLGIQHMVRTVPDFDADPKTRLTSGFLRLDGSLRPQDQLTILIAGQAVRNSHLDAQPHVASTATLRGYDRFEVIQGHWTHLPGRQSVWELSFGFSHSSPTDTLQLDVTQPNVTQLFTGEMTGAAPIESDSALSRFSFLAAGQTWHRVRHGRWQNRLDYGIDWEESLATEERRVFDGVRLLLYPLNVPSEVIEYNSPSHAKQRLREISLYLEDSLRISNRFFFRFGINFNASSAWLPSQNSGAGPFAPARQFAGAGEVVSWKTASPRAGVVVPFSTRLGDTRIFAGFARYYHLLPARYADYANPTSLSGRVLRWDDKNQDFLIQPGEEGTVLRTFGGLYSSVDPDLQRPYTNEWTIGLQQGLMRRLQLRLNLLRREDKKLVKSVNEGIPTTAYTPVKILDWGDDWLPGTSDDQILTVFNQDLQTLGQDRFLLTNPEGETASYKGLVASLKAGLTDRGFVDLSFTAYKSVGRAGPGNSEFENDAGAVDGLYGDPNALLNARGRLYFDRAYIGKIAAYYRAPLGLHFGTVISYFDGLPFGRRLVIPDFNQGPFFVMATPRGQPGGIRTQYNLIFDQRIARDFKIGRQRLLCMMDIFNLLNQNKNLQEYDLSGPLFVLRKPLSFENPRVIRFGIRWNL